MDAVPNPSRSRTAVLRVGRPALGLEEIVARVAAYCERYGVAVKPDGLPPFPSGRRETRQHREWLALYRARRRADQRRAAASAEAPTAPATTSDQAPASCPVCGSGIAPQDADTHRPRRRRPPLVLHRRCADLARAVEAAGPEATARLLSLLWPGRAGRLTAGPA
jgi:hypothetical protein